jgi:hypothetical protein
MMLPVNYGPFAPPAGIPPVGKSAGSGRTAA